jgi:hypothetical protein
MPRKTPVTVAPVDGEIVPAPTPFLSGRFKLYHTPDGGIHVSALFDGDDENETRHTEIPAMVLKMAERMGSGNPFSMLMGLGRKT